VWVCIVILYIYINTHTCMYIFKKYLLIYYLYIIIHTTHTYIM